jgi:protein subunit release factor A
MVADGQRKAVIVMQSAVDKKTKDVDKADYAHTSRFTERLSRRLAVAKDPKNRVPAEKVFVEIREKYGL